MKIIVVGGGTAGWWVAGYLAKFGDNYDITVIESPNIPKIGVGESVLPQTNLFFQKLGIEEKVWMKECEAVYKLGNMKQGWWRKDDEPFLFSFWWNYSENILRRSLYYRDGPQSIWRREGHSIGDYWLDMLARGEKTYEDFVPDMSDAYAIAKNRCQPFDQAGEPVLGNWAPYSYHINAIKAGEIVRDNIALPLGVKNIFTEVTEVKVDNGNITSIITNDGVEHTADLWVDCTGFQRKLIKETNPAFKEYPDNRVNAAWVAPWPYLDKKEELEPYTQSIGKPYGWQFKVTLTSRIGSGYVFDDRMLDPEQAKQDFLAMWPDRKPLLEPRLIKWTPSRLEEPWKGNVVAVGLSCYFIEPLEANGVYGVEYGVETLARVLEKGGHKVTPYNARFYSKAVGKQFDFMADFIKHHYMHTERDDTEFWRYYQDLAKSCDSEEMLWRRYQSYDNPRSHLFPDTIWLSMAIMFRKFKNRPNPSLDPVMFEHVKNHIDFCRRHSEAAAKVCKKVWE
jgi:tryptophan halogenase